VGLLVLGLVKERKLLALLVVILLGWQTFVPRAVVERVLMTYQAGQGLDDSAEGRVDLWQDALQVIDHDPVFGTGFDTYKFMGRVGSFTDTHNYYVKILVELGFVGFLVFLGLLVAIGKMSWRLFRSARDPFLSGLGCSLLAMFVCAITVNFFGDRWSFLQVNGFLWVLVGLVARGLILVKEQACEVESRELLVSSSLPQTSDA
jgi:O-antigen ligase